MNHLAGDAVQSTDSPPPVVVEASSVAIAYQAAPDLAAMLICSRS
ncbi:hypothetical protein [Streptomyces sp. ISL-100]|nr:hypothetical protein [Streptomyces sp. ISL-100]